VTQQKRACAMRIIVGTFCGIGIAICMADLFKNEALLIRIAVLTGLGIAYSYMAVGLIYFISAAMDRLPGISATDHGKIPFCEPGKSLKEVIKGSLGLSNGFSPLSFFTVIFGAIKLSIFLAFGCVYGGKFMMIDIRNCRNNIEASAAPERVKPGLPMPIKEPARKSLPSGGSARDTDW